MRVLLALILLLTVNPANKTLPKMPENSAQSEEFHSLKNEASSLQNLRKVMQDKADFWDDWYMGLGVAALILGTLSWTAQKRSSKLNGDLRKATTSIESKESRMREITDRASALEVQEAKNIGEQARRDAANANVVAENEKLARVKLEASIAPRRLSKEEQESLIAACLKVQYGKPISVRSYSGDVEGTGLAVQLFDALAFNGFDVYPMFSSVAPLQGMKTGIFVTGDSGEFKIFADTFGEALHRLHKLSVTVNGVPVGDSVSQDFSTPSGGMMGSGWIDSNAFPHVDILVAAKPIDILVKKSASPVTASQR